MVWKPDYVNATELASFLRIPAGPGADLAELTTAASSASRAVDRNTHRQFGNVAAPELRAYTAKWNRRRCRWVVKIDDLMDLVGVDVQVASVGQLLDYVLEPVNAAQEGRPFERLVVDTASSVQPTGDEYEVEITAAWGWDAFPVAVVQATNLQGSRFFNRRDAAFGIAGSPDTGSEVRLLDRVDPDVAVSLRDYVRDVLVVG